MPLIVPGIQSDNKTGSDWTNLLVGKKIGDTSNETTYAKSDLPKEHRIVKDGDVMTMDYRENRVNIHTADDGTVTKVTHG